jgi:hypothetical protein
LNCLLLLLAAGCQVINPADQQERPTVAPSAVVPATQEAEARAATSTPTATPAEAGEAVAVTPAPQGLDPELAYSQPFDLVKSKSALGGCHQDSPLALPAEGMVPLAHLPTRVCSNGEIALLEIEERLYVVQAGWSAAAFLISDVTDPLQPQLLDIWQWSPSSETADVKSFRQGERWYLALSLQGGRSGRPQIRPCGVAIVEVSDPGNPSFVTHINGSTVGSPDGWCNVHTSEVDTDSNGDGAFLMVSSNDTRDLRVIDIRNLGEPLEVNVYAHPDPSDGGSSFSNDTTLVHDTTVDDERVYVSYWGGGVIILDKHALEAGGAPEEVALNPPNSIDPDDFAVHHSYPASGGDFLFVEDEVNYAPPFSQLRLFDIRDLDRPREVLSLALEDPLSPPHNLLVEEDLLFVGWYNDGIRVFQYDLSDPENPVVEPAAFQSVRTELQPSPIGFPPIYNGIYGVRLHDCQVGGRDTTCVYASDLTLGLIISELE